jgi:hypothetical protein
MGELIAEFTMSLDGFIAALEGMGVTHLQYRVVK